jgi:hypothetical protein
MADCEYLIKVNAVIRAEGFEQGVEQGEIPQAISRIFTCIPAVFTVRGNQAGGINEYRRLFGVLLDAVVLSNPVVGGCAAVEGEDQPVGDA